MGYADELPYELDQQYSTVVSVLIAVGVEMPPLLQHHTPLLRDQAKMQEYVENITADLERAQGDISAVISQLESLQRSSSFEDDTPGSKQMLLSGTIR